MHANIKFRNSDGTLDQRYLKSGLASCLSMGATARIHSRLVGIEGQILFYGYVRAIFTAEIISYVALSEQMHCYSPCSRHN
jgi:hypothetical protein